MTGDPKFINITIGQLYPQESPGFTESDPGQFDTGVRVYLTHPLTQKRAWPQRGQTDAAWNRMYVSSVNNRQLESTLIELTVNYKGAMSSNKADRITPGADVQMMTLPARQGSASGAKANVIAPIPVPTFSRDYVTFTEPTLDGVGLPGAPTFAPALPSFSISYYPNTDEPVTLNYYNNTWILDSRTWDNTTPNAWQVKERWRYYYSIAI